MNSELLDVRLVDTGTAGVVMVRGEVDLWTCPVFEQALAEGLTAAAASGRPTVVVDLSAVSFLDSSGLGVLLAANQAAGVTLRLVVTGHAVKRTLQVSGTDRVLDVHPSLDAALAA